MLTKSETATVTHRATHQIEAMTIVTVKKRNECLLYANELGLEMVLVTVSAIRKNTAMTLVTVMV